MAIPEALLASVYENLRRLAEHQLARERGGHTLQGTALVHEAWLRLDDQAVGNWQSRAQFMAIAAEMMRRVLVDHARARVRVRRGSGAVKVSLSEAMEFPDGRAVEVLDLDRALQRLADVDPRKAKLVELRYFSGMTIDEAAAAAGSSPATAERDWRFARAFLQRELGER
jgi:RNA polymerase sigma-70 factor (ECF subfamily)